MLFTQDNVAGAAESGRLFDLQPSSFEKISITASSSHWYQTVYCALAEEEGAVPRAGEILLLCEDRLGGVYLFYRETMRRWPLIEGALPGHERPPPWTRYRDGRP
jgi:hypothetical protein